MMILSTLNAARRHVDRLRQEALKCDGLADALALQVALDCMDNCIQATEAARAEERRSDWLTARMDQAMQRVFGGLNGE